jgi:sucrose phosphorylase
VAPFVAIITETNVPHIDNIAYFGNGTNEAQMVYNFALPLLTLNSFLTEDVTTLSKWADTLDLPSDQATFFNFLAGHDGIGILPTTSILSSDELEKIIDQVNSIGGKVSYKSNEDGSKSPYELNINYLDALNDPEQPEDNLQIISERFLASQAIMLALRGVPGIYFHSIFGSRNWIEGVETTGRYRTINREKLDLKPLQAELDDPDSLRARIYQGYYHLLSIRKQNSVFHPYGGQKILNLHPKIFSLLRTSPDGQSQMLCLHNVTNQSLDLVVNVSELFLGDVCTLQNVVTGQQISAAGNQLNLHINPYEIFWLRN